MAETKSGAGPEEEPAQPRKKTAAKKAAPAKPAEPTPESIGIEGTVHVGGHHLDEEQGWVPDKEGED